jgi:hypothetical protein
MAHQERMVSKKLYGNRKSRLHTYTSLQTEHKSTERDQRSSMTENPRRVVPVHVVDDLIGQGLGYADWERNLKSLGYAWNQRVKDSVINRELSHLFKAEILELLNEPNMARKARDVAKTNSPASILYRLQGRTGERDQRLQE